MGQLLYLRGEYFYMEVLFKHWLGTVARVEEYVGPCIYDRNDYVAVNATLVGRTPRGFVFALWGEACGGELENLDGLVDRGRVVGSCRVASNGGFVELPRYEVKGLVLAKPVLVGGRVLTGGGSLLFQHVERYEGAFQRICIPPLAGIRWWVHNQSDDAIWTIVMKLNYPEGEAMTVVLKEHGVATLFKYKDNFYTTTYSLCKFVFGGRWLFWSPVGQPVSAPGAGSLTGAELPVVRRKDGYLRVGSWLAWHRVLGTLDDGRWVLVGDDGLYEAVFTATVERPLETFGEVGYVRVAGPYRGDVDDVQSPCGAPRLVACVEDTRDALAAAGHRCEAEGGVPHVLLGEGRVFSLGREALDWPLADTCAPLLKLGDYSLLDWRL
ncbi:hypothetical protein [Pyrobaculum sp.]|uniref:hypothetical protein n=1 Tax=Pyrobaculum sp. TaxID=2004705 RepID=UPI003D0BCC91